MKECPNRMTVKKPHGKAVHVKIKTPMILRHGTSMRDGSRDSDKRRLEQGFSRGLGAKHARQIGWAYS